MNRQWMYVATNNAMETPKNARSAMAGSSEGSLESHPRYDERTAALANSLLLQLPGFDWTLEVDAFGHHRITVHFKGADIAIDE